MIMHSVSRHRVYHNSVLSVRREPTWDIRSSALHGSQKLSELPWTVLSPVMFVARV